LLTRGQDEFSSSNELESRTLTSQSKIVALAKVRCPAKPADHHTDEDHEAPPKGANVPLLMHWFKQMDTYRDKHMNYGEDYCKSHWHGTLAIESTQLIPHLHVIVSSHSHLTVVNILATLPDYHRKGLGIKLLNRFLDDAYAAKAKTYIQAAEMGTELYPRFGWKDIEDLTIKTPKGPINWRCLMREPNAGRHGQ
jgi:GNAT superfamily N-acetyltransferase